MRQTMGHDATGRTCTSVLILPDPNLARPNNNVDFISWRRDRTFMSRHGPTLTIPLPPSKHNIEHETTEAAIEEKLARLTCFQPARHLNVHARPIRFTINIQHGRVNQQTGSERIRENREHNPEGKTHHRFGSYYLTQRHREAKTQHCCTSHLYKPPSNSSSGCKCNMP